MPLLVGTIPDVQPVTIECVAEVSRRYQIPVALLGGVLAQERGRLGQASPNKNGTWDIGPMQVNSAWLKFFAPYGITEHRLKHDGCANLTVGAWIIRYEQGRAKGDLWRAVGRYHSHQPDLAADYQGKVAAKVGELNTGRQTLARLLERPMGAVRQWRDQGGGHCRQQDECQMT
jgi:soluble lytic murein transglycosylase-like protein